MSSKQVKITPAITAKIRAAVGDPELDVSNFAVYEAATLSTKPIKQSGFYNQAVFTPDTLRQMSELLNTPGKALPLQVMHETNLLPVGKIFSAEVQGLSDGHTQLYTQFYLPGDKVNFINDINNAVIDEVSVGVMTNKAMCSECNFDYFGPDATFANLYTLTCNEDHTIGRGGVHVRCVGLKDFAEVSLVNRGAAKDAKILSRAKQAMGEDTVKRLAASALPIDARLVTLTNKLEAKASDDITNKGEYSMDKELVALLQTKSDEIAQFKVKEISANERIAALTSDITKLSGDITSKDAEIATLKASNTDGATLAAKVTAVETEMKEAYDKLLPHAKAALTASGVAEADLAKDLTALLAQVEKEGLKLHQIFGSDAKSDGGKGDAKFSAENRASLEAFKTKR